MKILLSAYACEPGRGSEPGIGWGVARHMANRHDTWVLTHAAHAPAIRSAVRDIALARAHFELLSLPVWLPQNLHLGSLGWELYYLLWQWQAFRVARHLHQTIGFDLVHHVTYGTAWRPTWMGRLGPPFVWSAGGKEVPAKAFLATMSRGSRALEVGRSMAIQKLGALAERTTANEANVILTASGGWHHQLPVRQMAVGGLGEDDLASLANISLRREGPFRIASVGRLLGWKGFAMGIAAFARLRREVPDAEYWIIGDGPERQALTALARRFGCQDAVWFLGWLPREETLSRLADVDVLVHPSLREQFGYVLLEAMAAGRPVVTLDLGGPRHLVGTEGGNLVRACDPLQVVHDVHGELRRLASNRQELSERGQRARRWVQEHWTWASVGEQLEQVYERTRNG